MRRCALLLSLLLGGCVVSVQPVIPAASAVFDARLIGRWGEQDGKDRIVIARGQGNIYEIEYRDSDGKIGKFEALLGRLGQRLVLDVQPAPRESSPMPEAASFIRGHMLYFIALAGDTARMALLDPKALRAAIAAKQVTLASFDDHDQVVLTGATEELRRALAGYAERPRALGEPSTWLRLKDRTQEDEVLEELGVLRAAAMKGDWEAMKRFFPAGSKWAEQAEQWVKNSDSQSVGFFERSAQNKVSEIRLWSPGRDTMDVVVPYSVIGDGDATYGARLIRGKSGWVFACSHEAHGSPVTRPGCGGSATFNP